MSRLWRSLIKNTSQQNTKSLIRAQYAEIADRKEFKTLYGNTLPKFSEMKLIM